MEANRELSPAVGRGDLPHAAPLNPGVGSPAAEGATARATQPPGPVDGLPADRAGFAKGPVAASAGESKGADGVADAVLEEVERLLPPVLWTAVVDYATSTEDVLKAACAGAFGARAPQVVAALMESFSFARSFDGSSLLWLNSADSRVQEALFKPETAGPCAAWAKDKFGQDIHTIVLYGNVSDAQVDACANAMRPVRILTDQSVYEFGFGGQGAG